MTAYRECADQRRRQEQVTEMIKPDDESFHA